MMGPTLAEQTRQMARDVAEFHRNPPPGHTCTYCTEGCGCPAGAHDTGQPGGFYVTVKDAGRTGWLTGPYDTHGQALADVADVRRMTRDNSNGWSAFYAFGTSRVIDGQRPPGRFNELLARWRAARTRDAATWPTPEAATYMDRIRLPAKASYAEDLWDALCLGEPQPEPPAGLSAQHARQVRQRISELVTTKLSTAPCAATSMTADGLRTCGQPGQHVNHTRLGHDYRPAAST